MYKIISGSERKVAAGGGENFDFESLNDQKPFEYRIYLHQIFKKIACSEDDTKRVKVSLI